MQVILATFVKGLSRAGLLWETMEQLHTEMHTEESGKAVGEGDGAQVGMEPVREEEEASTSDVEVPCFGSCQFMVTHHRKITFPQCGYLGMSDVSI